MASSASRWAAVLALVSVPALGWFAGSAALAAGDAPAAAPPPATPGADAGAPEKHLHNFFKLSEHVSSGAAPETDDDYVALAAAGVKVIVSVDGAAPDAEAAKRHGLRYVHLPIGYDGVSDEQSLRLAKVFASLEGPFYVHCHHGKHRGPAAATIARIVLDHAPPEQCVAEMKRAGTDPKYKGLYAVPVQFKVPDPAALEKVSGDFPAVAPVPSLQAAMVEADRKWERMKSVRVATWATPKDHPDVDPPHEAVMLAEWFRELARKDEVAAKPADFKAFLGDVEKASWELEKALQPGKVDAAAAEAAFTRVQQSCAACHAAHRDNTKQRR